MDTKITVLPSSWKCQAAALPNSLCAKDIAKDLSVSIAYATRLMRDKLPCIILGDNASYQFRRVDRADYLAWKKQRTRSVAPYLA